MPGGEEAPMGTDRDALRALAGQGIDLPAAVEALTRLAIETPSWGYGNSGTRFAVFPWPGAARTVWEKLEDAALAEVYGTMPSGMRMLLEYKFFEPAFYHTDLADWGMAGAIASRLSPQAEVLVDLGHHAQGTNIEHIVACLLDEGRLGGFHFNNRRYADDDLIVGSVNPFELFMIFHEILSAAGSADPRAAACAGRIAYMIDQSHNVEGKIEPVLLSVVNIHTAYAKALLVDRRTLARRQAAGDVLGAHQILLDAYQADVRPLLRLAREARRTAADAP